ncbi:unnamed protein product [Arctia plantaginis]|uniref:Uncharacterized protein n=1 Tax=Arctia plantaginis TaxID=874455 RepID=A0A8S0YY34_ARCPL|nr:unnamed protein product [Arctia plantaginis]CAB3242184.1 unnamed protein product [Arctia plantaginis]
MLPEITCKIKRCGVELKYFTQTTDYEDLYEALDLFDLKFNIVMNELLKNVPVLVADCPDDEASDDSTAEDFKEQVSCKKMKK